MTSKILETRNSSGSEEEYEYVIKPRAVETLINMLLKYGIDLRAQHYDGVKDVIVFNSNNLIEMKKLKLNRIVDSYRISKVRRTKEIVEEG